MDCNRPKHGLFKVTLHRIKDKHINSRFLRAQKCGYIEHNLQIAIFFYIASFAKPWIQGIYVLQYMQSFSGLRKRISSDNLIFALKLRLADSEKFSWVKAYDSGT